MRTGGSDPLHIAEIAAGEGVVGVMLCPGKRGTSAFGAPWRRDLEVDLDAIGGLAESLLACGGLDQLDLAQHFVRWWRDGENSVTGRCFDIGSTIHAALARFEVTGDPEAGPADPESAANGSIMRLAPIAIAYDADAAQAVAEARRQSRVTHAAAEPLDACALLAEILVDAIATGDRAWTPAPARPRLDARAPGDRRRQLCRQGTRGDHVLELCVHTLEAALWSVAETDDYRAAAQRSSWLRTSAPTRTRSLPSPARSPAHSTGSPPSRRRGARAWLGASGSNGSGRTSTAWANGSADRRRPPSRVTPPAGRAPPAAPSSSRPRAGWRR